jgi:RHS repeat-associated protein
MMMKNKVHWLRAALISAIYLLSSVVGHCFWNPEGRGDEVPVAGSPGAKAVSQCGHDLFGEVVPATGLMARVNLFRFSTRCQGGESEPLYYGYRYYNASTGRWLNRDPKTETGGKNLHCFVGNSPTVKVDALGLQPAAAGPWGPPVFSCPFCRCDSVEITYDPGGEKLDLGWYRHWWTQRFGSRVHVKWNVSGLPWLCHYYQDEKGTVATLTQTAPVAASGTSAGSNDHPVAQVYTDSMGRAFSSPEDDGSYTLDIKWEVTFRCVSTSPYGSVQRHDSFTASRSFTVPH